MMDDEEWVIGLLLLNCIGKIETMTRGSSWLFSFRRYKMSNIEILVPPSPQHDRLFNLQSKDFTIL